VPVWFEKYNCNIKFFFKEKNGPDPQHWFLRYRYMFNPSPTDLNWTGSRNPDYLHMYIYTIIYNIKLSQTEYSA